MVNKQETEVEYESSKFCDLACLRALLMVLNFICLLTGGFIFGVGIWTAVTKMQYVTILGSAYFNLIVALLIGAGCIVFITGLLGCIGSLKKNLTILLWYLIFLVIIFLFELIAGVTAFVYHESIHAELVGNMLLNLNDNYNQINQEALTEAVDMMQQSFQCCGVLSYSDWFESVFIKENQSGLGIKTPTSCCKTPSPACSVRDHPSNIYRVIGSESMGCLTQLELYIQKHIFFLAVTGVAVACYEILVIIVAFLLCKAVKNTSKQAY